MSIHRLVISLISFNIPLFFQGNGQAVVNFQNFQRGSTRQLVRNVEAFKPCQRRITSFRKGVNPGPPFPPENRPLLAFLEWGDQQTNKLRP